MARRIFNQLKASAAFWICLVVSITLTVAGFIVPPTGEIDGSVLTAVGELFGFATLWCVYHAIDKGIDAKMIIGKASIEINNPDDNKDNNSSEKEE